MGGVLAAYLTTLGIVSYRWFSGPGQAPPPITIAAAGGLFAGAALAGRADERLGNALGWAMVLAATFAPRSNLKPVQQAFSPYPNIIGTGGPVYHHLGQPGGVVPKKGHVYYKIAPGGKGYIPVDSTGKRIPGAPLMPRLLPGMQLFPGVKTGSA